MLSDQQNSSLAWIIKNNISSGFIIKEKTYPQNNIANHLKKTLHFMSKTSKHNNTKKGWPLTNGPDY